MKTNEINDRDWATDYDKLIQALKQKAAICNFTSPTDGTNFAAKVEFNANDGSFNAGGIWCRNEEAFKRFCASRQVRYLNSVKPKFKPEPEKGNLLKTNEINDRDWATDYDKLIQILKKESVVCTYHSPKYGIEFIAKVKFNANDGSFDAGDVWCPDEDTFRRFCTSHKVKIVTFNDSSKPKFKPEPWHENLLALGHIIKMDDGYYHFSPNPDNFLRAVSPYSLRSIADYIDWLNQDWDKQVQEDLAKLEPLNLEDSF